MNFWERITGSDIKKEFKQFKFRVKKLPKDYQIAWERVQVHFWPHSNLTGRNLMSILEGVLDLFEESAVEGLRAEAVLGDDIEGFCSALMDQNESKSFRNIWRKQLNNTIIKKLGK